MRPHLNIFFREVEKIRFFWEMKSYSDVFIIHAVVDSILFSSQIFFFIPARILD